ncbi:hypothetical protein FNF29_07913 [Cafeteria roenbergensis]|uniref:Uncharacterized protein n=1 Tax=Cafeteria roenbergensis TaxID=33653 RepID=A0A5A8C471_CAFRO|nr:hypothetical protein FNF29_07913 [Cafeteria roenbergensis]|eukprot:KAA0146671.1 hypothetical protein FNF29_07913 [Cafeteria roenbergensis]
MGRLAGTAAAAVAALLASADSSAVQLPALDALWQPPNHSVDLPQRAWLGGDSDWSIPLGNGSSLWLFGDTLVGPWNARLNQRVAAGAAMPHGTLARVDADAKSGAVRATKFWNSSSQEAVPTAWFVPNPKSVPGGGNDFLWTTAGVALPGNGPPGLAILCPRVRASSKAPGPFAFQVVRTTVVHVPNASGHPREWEYSTCDLPGTGSDAGLFWHTAAWLGTEPGIAASGLDGVVSLLGQTSSAAVLLRLPLDSLLQCVFDGGSVWASGGRGWVPLGPSPSPPRAEDLAPVFEPAESEATIAPRPPCAGGGFFSMWIPFGSARVRVRVAASPTGPWAEDASAGFSLPFPANDTARFFSYAAKAHSGMGAAHEGPCGSVVSVVTNAFNGTALFDPGMGRRLYVPTMWRIEWARAGPGGASARRAQGSLPAPP